MHYPFPPDVAQFIEARLASGAYSSEDDVLRDAIAALQHRDEEYLSRWGERNRLSQEQYERGLAKPLDDQQVIRRLRERLAQEGIVD